MGILNNDNSTDLAELAHGLEEAKKAIPKSSKILEGRKDPKQSYLICKNGIVAEMDKNEHKDGKVTIHETIG